MVNEILNVKVNMLEKKDDGKTKAICDLMFGDLFLVRGFTVKEGKKGVYIGMPQAKGETDYCPDCGTETQMYAVFSCVTPEVREYLKEIILEAYNEKE